MIWIIVITICMSAEILLFLVYVRSKNAKRKKVLKCLYKLLEQKVLEYTLRERITSEQAAMMEYRKPFLYVEFPDTRPLLMHIFSLDECVTIGRSRENIICIRDDMVSRLHCKISLVNGSLVLQDMMTANGTRIRRGIFKSINLMPGQQEFLYTGDILCMGDYRMKIGIYYGWEINA